MSSNLKVDPAVLDDNDIGELERLLFLQAVAAPELVRVEELIEIGVETCCASDSGISRR